MLKEDYKIYEGKMKKSIDSVAADFASVRAGRANASVLDRIMVDYYGSPTPIQQIAAISSPDARTLLISPWDKTAVKSIEKAIQNSDLGINPQNDGASIRLSFPQLTEERRKELVKQIHKYGRSQHPPGRHGGVQEEGESLRDHGGRSEAGGEGSPEADGRQLQGAGCAAGQKGKGTDGGVKAAGASGGSTAARRGHCTFCKVLSPFQGL